MFVPGSYQVANVGGRINFIPNSQNSFYFDADFTFQRMNSLATSPFANLSITGYFTDYRDAIDQRSFNPGDSMPGGYTCQSSGSVWCYIYDNVNKAQLWGAEVALNSKALMTSILPAGSGIFIDLSYAYTDTEQKSGDEKGKPLNDIPLHTLYGKLSYKTARSATYISYKGRFNKTTSSLQGTSGRVTYYTIPDFYTNIHLVDIGTSYRFKNDVSLGFVINNVLDKDFTRDFYKYSSSPTGIRSAYGTMLPGRNFWLTLSADF